MEKQPISKLNRNWMIHVAGIRAATAARAKGEDPVAMDSLLDGAMSQEGYALGPYNLVYSGATTILLEKLTERYNEVGEVPTTGHILFLLADPGESYLQLRTRASFKLDDFEAIVFGFMASLSGDQIKEASQWLKAEKARIEGQKSSVPDKLPQGEAGGSNG